MACLKLKQLREFQDGDRFGPEIRVHIENCPECRMDLFLLRELGPTLRPRAEVPGHLIDQVMATLNPAEEASPGSPGFSLGQLVITGLLGALTAVLVLAVSGTLNLENPLQPLALSLLVAGLSAVAHRRVETVATPPRDLGPS